MEYLALALSTWIPPRENEAPTPSHSHAISHIGATAQIVSGASLDSILNTSCSPSISGIQTTPRLQSALQLQSVTEQEPDKWSLIAKMIEQSGREVEKNSPVAAIHLQKEIHDLLYKYQLEALNVKTEQQSPSKR
ncbi:hypothetical protein WR25_13112 [Diploscapter pachys]|uniref:Uncharacterized protein n=1 Tax=Diploscapter pachys TaxID=2018661 RepID=A0A2A2M1N2_9BILA|nr:hypothetical protein WR25_13112 [Diploscapter pachys]